MQKIMGAALLCLPVLQILPLSRTPESICIETVGEHPTKMDLTIIKIHRKKTHLLIIK